MKICIENTCNKRIVAHELCAAHYYHWRKTNTVRKYKNREIHGMKGTPEYRTWDRIISRTSETKGANYENYRSRGISVCARWRQSFVAFYEDMGKRPSPKHTIERKNSAGNYEPSNCIWATRDVQAINRRMPKSNTSGHKGVTQLANGKWKASIGIDKKLLYLGCYPTFNEAVLVRKNAEAIYFTPRLEQ